jgi:hypothetical protein
MDSKPARKILPMFNTIQYADAMQLCFMFIF